MGARARSSGSLGSSQSQTQKSHGTTVLSHESELPQPVPNAYSRYFMAVLMGILWWSAISTLLFSSVGIGQEVLDWLQKYDFFFYPLTGIYVIGFTTLYLLDFYVPPHLPGQYLRLSERDRWIGRTFLGFFTACFVGSSFFMCNTYPSVPVIACVLFLPVVVAVIRWLVMPTIAEPSARHQQEDAEQEESYLALSSQDVRRLRAKYVRNIIRIESDAGSWWQAVFTAFIVSSAVTVAAWLAWVFTIGEDINDLNDANRSEHEKEEKWILWSTPGIIGLCNLIFALFSALRLKMHKVYLTARGGMMSTSGTEATASQEVAQDAAVRHLIAIVKVIGSMFVLTIGFLYVGVQLLYTDSKIASMVMGLMGALFVLFAVCTYLSFRAVVEAMGHWLKELPMWKTARSAARSDWARALFLIIIMFPAPPLLLLSLLTQRVRNFRDLYGKNPSLIEKAVSFGRKDPRKLWLTPRIAYALEQMRKWDTIPIIFKCYLLCGLAFMFQVAPVCLNLGLSWVKQELADWNFGLIMGLTFAIGLVAFLLPPVPGMTIYLFGGLMLSATCPIGGRGTDKAGFWWGAIINVGLGWALKLAACAIQQVIIGGFLGRFLWVRQTVGVHKVLVRSLESVLRKPGLNAGKVAILCGAPDWPTSVGAGMLGLSLLECELGTVPIILFVAPCGLAGSFYLRRSESQLWENAANMMLFLALFVNVSLWAVAAWATQSELEKHIDKLCRPLAQNVDLEWLDFKAEMVQKGIALTWEDVPPVVGRVYVFGAVVQAAICIMMQFRYYWFFHQFQVSDDINTIKSWDDLITARGAAAVATYFLCWICYFVFSQWLFQTTWRQEILLQKKLAKAEKVWKAEWVRQVKGWKSLSEESIEEALQQREHISKAAFTKATRPPGEGRQLLLEEEEDIEEDRRIEEQEEARHLFASPQVGAKAIATLSMSGVVSFVTLCGVGALSLSLRAPLSEFLEEFDIHDFGPLFYILMGAVWLVSADLVRKLVNNWQQGGERFKAVKKGHRLKPKKQQRWPSEFLCGIKERKMEDFAQARQTKWRPPPPGSTLRLSPFGAQDWRANQLCGVLAPQLMTEQVVKSHVLATAVGLLAGILAWWVRLVPKFKDTLAGWSDIMFDNLASGATTRTVALALICIALAVFIASRVRSTFRAVHLAWRMQGSAQDLAHLVGALLAPLRNDEQAPEVVEALWTVYRYLMVAQYLTYEAVSSRLKLAGGQDSLFAAGLLTSMERDKLMPRSSEERFQPGRLGLDMDWVNGIILGVQEDGQAAGAGVREGWQITKINDADYSQAYFRKRLTGHKHYKVIFDHELPEARALEVMKWLSFALQRMVSTRLIPQAFGAALLRPLEDFAQASLEMCTAWGTAPPKLLTPLMQFLALTAMALTPMAILQSFDTENDAPTHYVFAVLGSSAIALVLRCTIMVGEELNRPFSDGVNALNPDWLLMQSEREIFTSLVAGEVPPIHRLAEVLAPKETKMAAEVDISEYYEDPDDEEKEAGAKSVDVGPSQTPSQLRGEWEVPSEAAESEYSVPADAMSAIRSWSGRSSQADTGGSIATTIFHSKVNTQLVEACYAGLEYPKPVTFDDCSVSQLEETFAKPLSRLVPEPNPLLMEVTPSIAEEASPSGGSPATGSPTVSPLSPLSPESGASPNSNKRRLKATPRSLQAIDAAIARVTRAVDAAVPKVPQSGVGPGAVQEAVAAGRPNPHAGTYQENQGGKTIVLELLATLHHELRSASNVRLQAIAERTFAPPVTEIVGPEPQSTKPPRTKPVRPKGERRHRRLEVIPEGEDGRRMSIISGDDIDSIISEGGQSEVASEGVRRRQESIFDLDEEVSEPEEGVDVPQGQVFMSRSHAMAGRRQVSGQNSEGQSTITGSKVLPAAGGESISVSRSSRPLGGEGVKSRADAICLRPGCGRPTMTGEPNEYCSRACREQDTMAARGGGPRQDAPAGRSYQEPPEQNVPQPLPLPPRKNSLNGQPPAGPPGMAPPERQLEGGNGGGGGRGSRRSSVESGQEGLSCARPGCGRLLRNGKPGDYCSRICRSLDKGKDNGK